MESRCYANQKPNGPPKINSQTLDPSLRSNQRGTVRREKFEKYSESMRRQRDMQKKLPDENRGSDS